MAAKKLLALVIAVFAFLLAIQRPNNAFKILDDPICEEVNDCFEYCEDFIDGIARYATRECCDNLLILNGRVKYVDNGVSRYCYCIEDFSNSHYHPPYLQNRIGDLTTICGIHRSFPISEHMDCSK